ncbi:Uncharacterised protein [Mycobacteroides abscessus subsp. abscessus]|nr:Uncharacterised protein [Mycobacteroides abscessus subsp. abscessus]
MAAFSEPGIGGLAAPPPVASTTRSAASKVPSAVSTAPSAGRKTATVDSLISRTCWSRYHCSGRSSISANFTLPER